jgi:hypothetical protein
MEKPDESVIETAQLASVKLALHEFHQALNNRKNSYDAFDASVAFIQACEKILNQPWKPAKKTGLDKPCAKGRLL